MTAEPAKLYWHPNTLVLPLGGGLLRLFQASYRRNVLATAPIMGLIDAMVGGVEAGRLQSLFEAAGQALQLADATRFTLWEHTGKNSDFFDTSVGRGQLAAMPFGEFVELLSDSGMVSPCWPPEFSYEKRSFGDRFRGDFHEQLGTESLFTRTPVAQWWTRQKFTDDLAQTRPTPYRYIEDKFLREYFAAHFKGLTVLEAGSGTGYYTRLMAQHASRAVGVDYNADYVGAARRNYPPDRHPNLEFHVGNILELTQEGVLAPGQYDRLVLIDTFLFLFAGSFQGQLYANRHRVLRNLAALLKADGILLVMDPHPLWLTPWIGSQEMPLGVLTEYRQRHFKVVPTLEEMTGLLFESDLRVRRVLEPQIDPEYARVDPQGCAFMSQVPQWWFFEIEKARK